MNAPQGKPLLIGVNLNPPPASDASETASHALRASSLNPGPEQA